MLNLNGEAPRVFRAVLAEHSRSRYREAAGAPAKRVDGGAKGPSERALFKFSFQDINRDPDFFPLDRIGNRITYRVYGFCYLDFGVRKFIDYWVEAVNTDIITQPWKGAGIYVDGPSLARYAFPPSSNLEEHPTGRET